MKHLTLYKESKIPDMNYLHFLILYRKNFLFFTHLASFFRLTDSQTIGRSQANLRLLLSGSFEDMVSSIISI